MACDNPKVNKKKSFTAEQEAHTQDFLIDSNILSYLETADRRTLSSYERDLIGDYHSFLSEVWGQSLTKSHGVTDEGEAWVVISQDTPEGVKTLSAISIEINNGVKTYRYFCSPRQISFLGETLSDVIEQQAPPGIFKQFMEFHTEALHEEDSANVIQLIPAS